MRCNTRQTQPYYIVVSSGFSESSIANLVHQCTHIITTPTYRHRRLYLLHLDRPSNCRCGTHYTRYIILLVIKIPCTTAIHSYIYIYNNNIINRTCIYFARPFILYQRSATRLNCIGITSYYTLEARTRFQKRT